LIHQLQLCEIIYRYKPSGFLVVVFSELIQKLGWCVESFTSKDKIYASNLWHSSSCLQWINITKKIWRFLARVKWRWQTSHYNNLLYRLRNI